MAVIRLAGKGYRWLPWAERPHQIQPAWAVGHPDAIIDVRRTKGSVYDVITGDLSPMAAIRHAVRSSVPVEAGSSGSPLVDRDGGVVGVVYASASEDSFDAYAASRLEVEPAVTRIRQGHHPADVGVAAFAAVDDQQPVGHPATSKRSTAPSTPWCSRSDTFTRYAVHEVPEHLDDP